MDQKLLEEYRRYITSDEGRAVLFVKKYLNASKDKWIDILSYDEDWHYDHHSLQYKKVVCELFTKKMRPKYNEVNADLGKYSRDNRYITWVTARTDIDNQRSKGIKGPCYEIVGRLIKTKSRFVDDAPAEIKALEKNPNDKTNPLWDIAVKKYMRESEYDYVIKYIKRL